MAEHGRHRLKEVLNGDNEESHMDEEMENHEGGEAREEHPVAGKGRVALLSVEPSVPDFIKDWIVGKEYTLRVTGKLVELTVGPPADSEEGRATFAISDVAEIGEAKNSKEFAENMGEKEI